MWKQNKVAFQAVVDQFPRGIQYCSDQNPIYAGLEYYPGKFSVSEDRTDTFSVEGINAELRHFLARLVRRSRFFSRCPHTACVCKQVICLLFIVRNVQPLPILVIIYQWLQN